MVAGTLPPVLIMMTSRSGSSMVASIFAEHGLWAGRIERPNQFGYRHYENIEIRERLNGFAMVREGGARMKRLEVPLSTVRAFLDSVVPPGTRWVYKTGIDSWSLFDGLYEGTKYVFVRRPVESVVASLDDKGGNHKGNAEHIVRARYAFMDELSAERGIPFIYTDDVVKGDYSSLERAFEHCGLEFNPEIADRMIDESKWNH